MSKVREYTDPAIYDQHRQRFERTGLPRNQEEWIQRAAGTGQYFFAVTWQGNRDH